MYKAQRDHQMGNVGQDGGFSLKLGCRGCLKLGCQEPAWGWSGLSKRKQGIEYGTVTGLANQNWSFIINGCICVPLIWVC